MSEKRSWDRPDPRRAAASADAAARGQAGRGEVKGEPAMSAEDQLLFEARVTSDTPACDLHGGLDRNQAWNKVTSFLEDQAAMGIRVVKLIPGTGTGALHEVLIKRLPSHPRVQKIQSIEGTDAVMLVLLRAETSFKKKR